MLGIGQVECVSYGVVYGVSYCVGSEKALINKDDCQERELRVKLCTHHLVTSWMFLKKKIPLNLCVPL